MSETPSPQTWAFARQYMRPAWRRLLLLELLLLAAVGLKLFSPQILRRFIDVALGGAANPGLLQNLALAYMGVALSTQVFSVAATYLGERLGWTITNDIRADLAHHCLNLDLSFHKTQTPGALIERIDGDVTTVANFFSQFLVRVIGNLFIIVGVVALLFLESPWVGLAVGVVSGFNLLVLNRLSHFAVPAWQKARQASAELFGYLEERLVSLEDIQANGAGAHTLRGLHPLSRIILQTFRRANLAHALMFVVTSSFFFVGDAISLGTGAYLALQGIITVGTVYLIYNYGGLLFRPLNEIQEQVRDLQKALASLARIQGLFAVQSRLPDTGRSTLPGGPLPLRFDQVGFRYEDDEQTVLRAIDFQLPAGATLGLLGRTGSGKTTLTRLLFRLYDPTSGAIELAGANIGRLSLAALRARVGMVTQEVQLFQASVRDNITFFDAAVADEQILAVIAELGLSDWLARLPAGLDTVLGADSRGLSAGEGQLLAFARVFLKDPGLIILDEPSARLDLATEKQLQQAIDRLLTGRTAIVIAHRLQTVERADWIMVLEMGRVLEFGRRQELAANPDSHFARLRRGGALEMLA